jgi:hypothetical protein
LEIAVKEAESIARMVVGYWSSHLAGAQSELVVPTGHDAHLHPKTIADLRRILLSNLRSR